MLEKKVINVIQSIVKDIRKEYQLGSYINDGVFEILESKCTVVYYPLVNEDCRGFRVKKYMKDGLKDFVYINTDKSIEQQIFTAAHELGHVLNVAESVIEMIPYDGTEDMINDYEEEIINRFAAELLMDENQFRIRVDYHKNNLGLGDSLGLLDFLRLIARLMDDFMVPFNSVRKRFYELSLIDEDTHEFFRIRKKEFEEKVSWYLKDNNTRLDKDTNNKAIPGLRELIKKVDTSDNDLLVKKIKKEFDINELDIKEDYIINIKKVE